MAIFESCRVAINEIHHELSVFGVSNGTFNGLDKVKIKNSDPIDVTTGRFHRIYHFFKYEQNVHVEEIRPGPDGSLPPVTERPVVDDGGVRFVLIITDKIPLISHTGVYRLPLGDGKDGMRLIYYLEENPKNPSMEEAVRGMIEKNVATLRVEIEDALNVNPDFKTPSNW
jgi:hypothetical protein